MDQALMASLGVSLAIGLLVGLERQRVIARKEGRETLLGGVRTFPLIALGGSAAMLLGLVAAVVALASMAALMAVYRLSLTSGDREPGLTTEMAALFTFLLGALAVSSDALADVTHRLLTCAALAVVATLLLSVKPRLHAVVRRISDEDLLATVQILVVAVVVLPMLPNRAFGPFDAINPQTVGRLILFVGFVSFIGYAASRLLGNRRGLAVAGFVGGLVSSTAVTFSMSRRARADERIQGSCALAVTAASAMMYVRVLIAVLVVHAPLVLHLLLPLGAMLLAGAAALFFLWRRVKDEQKAVGDVELTNPFELRSAVVFGILFALVTFGANAVRVELGDSVLPLAGLVAGTTDVDAITLSTSALARDGLSPTIAALTILAACFANTAVKAGIAWVTGGKKFGLRVGVVFGVMAVVGAAAAVVQSLVVS